MIGGIYMTIDKILNEARSGKLLNKEEAIVC
jgi:hypothetical protein